MASDVMISANKDVASFVLPTRENPYAYESGIQERPVGLLQKLVFINNRVVLGWAGSVFQARVFVQYLRVKLRDVGLDLQKISDVLDEYPENDLNGLSAFLTVDFVTDVGSFSINTLPYELGRIEHLWCLGTGCSDFYRFAQGTLLRNSDDSSDIEDALSFIGTAICSQAGNGFGLKNHWGGGFQVVVRMEAGFRPLDRVLVRGWVFYNQTGGVDKGPFFYLFYHQSQLVVCRLFGEDKGDYALAKIVDEPNKCTHFPYGSHSPEWTVDIIHRDEDLRFPHRIVQYSALKPEVHLWHQGFFADVGEDIVAELSELARSHFV